MNTTDYFDVRIKSERAGDNRPALSFEPNKEVKNEKKDKPMNKTVYNIS